MATITNVYNADGVLLAASGAWKTLLTGQAKVAETLVGTDGNDVFRGNGGGDTLSGGRGDDVYNIYDIKDVVIENAGGGVDTVQATVSYVLGANIENLLLTNNNTIGMGNSLNNILMGGDGQQTLDGGAGNDVLTGGAGNDIFVMNKGGGRDVITDFQNGVDQVRLGGFGLTSFAEVKANMKQVGNDTLLSLASGEQVLFRGHAVADFSASDFALGLDKSSLKLTFNEDFNSLSLYDSTSGMGLWRPMLAANGVGGRTLATNNEVQVYMDPSFAGTGKTPLGVNPFSINGGVLSITAAKATPEVSAAINNYPFTSGILTTKFTFAQEYGYFEMRAKLPDAKGMWPAFWLLPADGTWPSELDVLEQLGKDPNTAYMTSHSLETGKHTADQDVAYVTNATTEFHTYGLLWDQDHLVYYIDGVKVAQQDTAADMHKPMYMLVSLGVGNDKSWAGGTDPNFVSANLDIDYIRAYSLPDQGGVAKPTTDPLYKGPAQDHSTVPATGSSSTGSTGTTGSGSTTPPASGSGASTTVPTPPVTDTPTSGGSNSSAPPQQPASDPIQGTLPKVLAGTAGATDHHTIKLADLSATATGPQVKIANFAGSGVWQASDNDWLSLTGFGKGSVMTWDHDDAANSKLGFYKIHDTTTNRDYMIQIEALNGKHAILGDFNFY